MAKKALFRKGKNVVVRFSYPGRAERWDQQKELRDRQRAKKGIVKDSMGKGFVSASLANVIGCSAGGPRVTGKM